MQRTKIDVSHKLTAYNLVKSQYIVIRDWYKPQIYPVALVHKICLYFVVNNVKALNVHAHYHSSKAQTTALNTVNRGDFGQIFTIFINIFIMMNSILHFIWGLVSTMLEHHILYTLISSWLLNSEIFSVEPCPKSPRSSGWLWTHQYIYGFPK